ncbi:MarR family transcriptional regulator [Streptococcus pseudoporcinus]|uniref:MarR family transcriptional regulator n=1 Tax=Streptococcus pseudoporcinus TaxID=361101 RepID=A0A4U9XK07_9STRE|nr:helix-turn-helix domain-containing protein [Streptococcus pseudoporcinus]VTS13603.1 MarR family transcriptional regulator [Streptococcus pseudoporcinus]
MSRIIADLRDLTHQIEQISEEIAKRYNLAHLAGPQGHVLNFLSRNVERELFVKDIETELGISKSVASNLVKRMEKNGFIKVIPSQTDKRYKQVVMAEKGVEKLPLLQECRKDVENYFFKEISMEEFCVVRKVIDQLKQNMLDYKKGEEDA